MKALRTVAIMIGVAGLAGCAAMLVRMIVVVAPGGSCGGNNLPACSPKATRALETLPISIGGIFFFIFFIVISLAVLRGRNRRIVGSGQVMRVSGPAMSSSYGGPANAFGNANPTSPFGNASPASPFDTAQAGGGFMSMGPSMGSSNRPKWTVPDECPNCGAKVDQATASFSDNPTCPFCSSPIPVQPYNG